MADDEGGGAPAWMISFGDMMTLILTFFILLVSMSKEQQEGLVATGVGSFLVALRSFGLPGVLDASEEAAVFENVRMRFNLPPEDDPERRDEHRDAATLELLRATAARALKPHDELNQPGIARFDLGSDELTETTREYLDALAPSLRPSFGQALLIEGHAGEDEVRGRDHRWLAFARAQAVAAYLIEEHDFPAPQVEPRAWVTEIESSGPATRVVDARLVIPSQED